MATTPAVGMTALRAEVIQQRELVHTQREQLYTQQAVLDAQSQRIAEIQAELDLVKATARLAMPTSSETLIVPQLATPALSFPLFGARASAPAERRDRRFALAYAAPSLAVEMRSEPRWRPVPRAPATTIVASGRRTGPASEGCGD
jgi:hypothetical protein